MLYLTFNDAPTGIYFSQVTDVCKFIRDDLKEGRIRLVAFISLRSFLRNKSLIRAELPDSIVVPMMPTMRLWKLNLILLRIIVAVYGNGKIISRGPYATWLALSLKKLGCSTRVVFDARGAYAAELNEYTVVKNETIKKDIGKLENFVLRASDFRMGVSEKLIAYWKREYGFESDAHVVIPCTLNSFFLEKLPDGDLLALKRKELGFDPGDCVLVYSGSSAGWQSFDLVDEFLDLLLRENPRLKVLFLAHTLPPGLKTVLHHPDRFQSRWVAPSQVRELLCVCDWGLIIRENTVTNEVASPVKFAEYLSCGLPVMISAHVGDYSEFVQKHQCGRVVTDIRETVHLEPVSPGEKKRIQELAGAYFSKTAYRTLYQKMLA